MSRADGHIEYDKRVESEEFTIRESIRKELILRETEGKQYPHLGNYSGEHEDVWYWWQHESDNHLTEDGANQVDAISEFVNNQLFNNRHEVSENRRRCKYTYPDTWFLRPTDAPANRLNDWDLIQLDAKLGRIKWNRSRITNYRKGLYTNSGTVLLGVYFSSTGEGKDATPREIYLFIDAIRQLAANHNSSPYDFLAEVFTHEMFHAYFDGIKSKAFLSNILGGVMEIQEALTECAMLMFLKEYDNYLFLSAKRDVNRKYGAGMRGNPALLCYGLGSYLFDEWSSTDPLNGSLLSNYQKISPSPRLSNKLVNMLVKHINNPNIQNHKEECEQLLSFVLYGYNSTIPSASSHFLFMGRTYGFSNQMARAVIEHYIQRQGHTLTFTKMVKDFQSGSLQNLTNNETFFLDKKGIQKYNIESKYNMDDGIILPDSTEIFLAKNWRNNTGGITERFIKQVRFMKILNLVTEDVHELR